MLRDNDHKVLSLNLKTYSKALMGPSCEDCIFPYSMAHIFMIMYKNNTVLPILGITMTISAKSNALQ